MEDERNSRFEFSLHLLNSASTNQTANVRKDAKPEGPVASSHNVQNEPEEDLLKEQKTKQVKQRARTLKTAKDTSKAQDCSAESSRRITRSSRAANADAKTCATEIADNSAIDVSCDER